VRKQVEAEFLGTRVPEKSPPLAPSYEFLGTRVPEKSGRGRPKVALDSHALDDETGRRIASVTGSPISGRLVRNYLRLLELPAEVQELAEAGGLTEGQLRPVCALDDPAAQLDLVKAIIAQGLSSADAEAVVEEVEAAAAEARPKVLRRAQKQPPAVQYGRRFVAQVKALERMTDQFDDLAREWATVEEYQPFFDALLRLEELIQRVKAYREGRAEVGLATQSKYAG